MSFLDHYFAERGDGSAFTQFTKDVVGGDAPPSTRQRIDIPSQTPDKRFGKRKKIEPEKESEPKTTDTEAPAEEKPTEEKPKTPRVKEIPASNRFGGYGYMNDDDHTIFNSIESDITSGKFDEFLAAPVMKSNQEKMTGYKIVFKPTAKDPDMPDHARTMYIFKNRPKYKHKGGDWASIVFRGRESFKDSLKLFFPGLLKSKENLKDVAHNIKWYQASPKAISNPLAYASWTNTEIPEEDVQFTADAIKDALEDAKETSESFLDFYEYDTLSENIVDDLLIKTFKGIGGGIKRALMKPPVKKLKNPNELLRYFPRTSTYRVTESAYNTVNTLASESLAEWMKVKEEYGVIAQKFITSRNIYVKKIFDISLIAPKSVDRLDAFVSGFDNVIKAFDIDEENFNFEIQDARIHNTTNGGYISTMMFRLIPKGAPSGEGEDGKIGDITTGAEGEETIFIVGADNKGLEFFDKKFNSPMKQFLQRYKNASLSTINKAKEQMSQQAKEDVDSFVKSQAGSSKKAHKRTNIPNREFNTILKNFDKEVRASGKLKGEPKQAEKNGMMVTTYTTNNGGKILFVNDGKGKPGRIVVTPNGKGVFFNTVKADDIGKYTEESM